MFSVWCSVFGVSCSLFSVCFVSGTEIGVLNNKHRTGNCSVCPSWLSVFGGWGYRFKRQGQPVRAGTGFKVQGLKFRGLATSYQTAGCWSLVLVPPICYSYSNFQKIIRDLCVYIILCGLCVNLFPWTLLMFHAKNAINFAKNAKKITPGKFVL